MSKPIVSLGAVTVLAIVGLAAAPVCATAADLLYPRHHNPAIGCGPCGCLHVSYVYHRELESTYGPGFDPRDFDQTEPYYYLGRMRAYPRFWVDAGAAQ
jgi:hypothetical protein